MQVTVAHPAEVESVGGRGAAMTEHAPEMGDRGSARPRVNRWRGVLRRVMMTLRAPEEGCHAEAEDATPRGETSE